MFVSKKKKTNKSKQGASTIGIRINTNIQYTRRSNTKYHFIKEKRVSYTCSICYICIQFTQPYKGAFVRLFFFFYSRVLTPLIVVSAAAKKADREREREIEKHVPLLCIPITLKRETRLEQFRVKVCVGVVLFNAFVIPYILV